MRLFVQVCSYCCMYSFDVYICVCALMVWRLLCVFGMYMLMIVGEITPLCGMPVLSSRCVDVEFLKVV